jgi:hypothetical protein
MSEYKNNQNGIGLDTVIESSTNGEPFELGTVPSEISYAFIALVNDYAGTMNLTGKREVLLPKKLKRGRPDMSAMSRSARKQYNSLTRQLNVISNVGLHALDSCPYHPEIELRQLEIIMSDGVPVNFGNIFDRNSGAAISRISKERSRRAGFDRYMIRIENPQKMIACQMLYERQRGK